MRHDLKELLHMLSYRRPMGSGTERSFIDRYVRTLPNAWIDHARNWHVVIGDNDARILWSSHTDTVHWKAGRQTIAYDPQSGIVRLSKRSLRADESNCLGADCTVGVWIMRNMIMRGVSGHYVFHYGEERGGIGSSAIAEEDREWLRTFDFAIAFDRRGTRSIITEQGGSRTASAAFAHSMAEQLALCGLKMAADDWGIFTDTANYADDIAECSNLSVGFRHEHSTKEQLDTKHALRLLDAMCSIDLRALVADRDPDEEMHYRIARWNAIEAERNKAIDMTDRWKEDRYTDDRLLGVCVKCGLGAMVDRQSFECEDCEEQTLEQLEHEERSTYLDPIYADVQAELIEQLKRRKR